MRMLIATLLATATIFSPLNSWAQSVDIEATIRNVDVSTLSLTLDDGKTYKVPDEFNFEGAEGRREGSGLLHGCGWQPHR